MCFNLIEGIKVPTISIVGGTPAAEGEFSYVVTRIAFLFVF
jgi:hypothetical protein